MIIETEHGLALISCFQFYDYNLRSGDFFQSVKDHLFKVCGTEATQKQIDVVLREVEFKKIIAIREF